MKEIQETLTRIFDQVMKIWYDPKILHPGKDEVAKIFIESVDMVLDAFSPQTINKLVLEEYRKKNIEEKS